MNASFHILSNSGINRPIIRHCIVEATDSIVNETKLINKFIIQLYSYVPTKVGGCTTCENAEVCVK